MAKKLTKEQQWFKEIIFQEFHSEKKLHEYMQTHPVISPFITEFKSRGYEITKNEMGIQYIELFMGS